MNRPPELQAILDEIQRGGPYSFPATRLELEYGDLSHLTFRMRVLEPLVQFGLMEERVVGVEDRWRELVEYRVTPLYERALSFEREMRAAGAGGGDIFLMR